MVSKCANPTCFAAFRYLRQGTVFNVEIKTASNDSPSRTSRVEHFWLCEDCARVMKVVWQDGAVSVRPLYRALSAGA